MNTDVGFEEGAWLFGEVAALAVLDPDVCSVVEAWLFGVVAAVALLGSDVCFGADLAVWRGSRVGLLGY